MLAPLGIALGTEQLTAMEASTDGLSEMLIRDIISLESGGAAVALFHAPTRLSRRPDEGEFERKRLIHPVAFL